MKELIESLFGLSVQDIFVLGQGSDSIAYLVNDTYIFKRSKHEDAKNSLKKDTGIIYIGRVTL